MCCIICTTIAINNDLQLAAPLAREKVLQPIVDDRRGVVDAKNDTEGCCGGRGGRQVRGGSRWSEA
jgi:hypothetical protein